MFEAMYWKGVDEGRLQPSCNPRAVFRQRGHWKAKNNREETSRDRFTQDQLGNQIAELESELGTLGYGPHYCAGIRARATAGRNDVKAQRNYIAALKRTLAAKRRSAVSEPIAQP